MSQIWQAILSSHYTGVEIISADTTYADHRSADQRGLSLACVLVHGASLDVNCARVYGRLRDGRRHDATLATLSVPTPGAPPVAEGGDPRIGCEVGDGWWVKAKIARGVGKTSELEASSTTSRTTYLCCRGDKRHVEYKDVVEG